MIKGEQLRYLRILHDLTQAGLGWKLGITQQAVSDLEKKRWIAGEQFFKIREVFGYNKDDLEIVLKVLSHRRIK